MPNSVTKGGREGTLKFAIIKLILFQTQANEIQIPKLECKTLMADNNISIQK